MLARSNVFQAASRNLVLQIKHLSVLVKS
ncbi:hypothetical protein NB231_09193 [Nitrococcus mobilis Nb-231]|uniref:Uncharacterized protein n=1 Tax=Nitrococcus mobilis Nb-231 TaxID=314278 RepID=A4BN16_9GAMM|nr:hypothetical protein NB231_09193 [Nitrococcus mobilis Nb-231]